MFMSGVRFGRSGLEKRKVFSLLTAAFMITGTVVFIIPMTMPTVAAYATPGIGVTWTFDDLVINSGGAVTGGYPNYQINDPLISISPSDTIRLNGGEIVDVLAPGCVIEVLGAFDGTAGLGSVFHGNGFSGFWQGFFVEPMSMFMIQGVTITDAADGVWADGTIMTDIRWCTIYHCQNMGINYNFVMGGPMIVGNNISDCGIGIKTVDSSSMIMGNNISGCAQAGIYASGMAGPWMNNNRIYDCGLYGIHFQNFMGGSVDDCNIYQNQIAGIFVQDSFVSIYDNNITGMNWPSWIGFPGGHGIIMNGSIANGWTCTMSGNTIKGGNGSHFDWGPDPDGGRAIWLQDFEGGHSTGPQAVVENNLLIRGGHGGWNNEDDGRAGDGGTAIYIDSLSTVNDPSTGAHSIIIRNNPLIIGGSGGINNATLDGEAGHGGIGVHVKDYWGFGSVLIENNGLIQGGHGGENSADFGGGGSNWRGGDGGPGIMLEHIELSSQADLFDNTQVRGGKGGDASGNSGFMFAGMGGDAIKMWGCNHVTIDPSDLCGGSGGNNTGTFNIAGDGGHGINLELSPSPTVQWFIDIISVNATGGKGGDDYSGAGPGGGGAGKGGDGLSQEFAYVTSTNTNYYGGPGGDVYADGGMGGPGGRGIHVWSGSHLVADGGSIIGGEGGDTFYNGPPMMGTWAGWGDYAVYGHDAQVNVTLLNMTLIQGGEGGDNHFDTGGDAGSGTYAIMMDNAERAVISGNEITAGEGGHNFDGSQHPWGSIGMYVLFMTNPIAISDNYIHECDGEGISLINCEGVIDYNYIFNCSPNPNSTTGTGLAVNGGSPDIHDNYIFNCTNNGIELTSSSSHLQRNTIENVSSYGILFDNADPLVENCTIIDAHTTDFYLRSDSHPICLNTTSGKEAAYEDEPSNLTMQWYMQTQVVDQFLAPVPVANVWINDTFGGNSGSGVTDANGWFNWTVVTEYVENMTTRVHHTAHNATATSGLQKGWANPEPFMDASRDVIIVLGAPSFNIFLNQGWNLISIPLEQADESIDQVLRTIDGEWDFLRIYDPLSTKPWKSNCTYWPLELIEFDTLDHTQGIWIHITSPTATLTVTGTVPVATNIPLYAGINLVGYPSFTEKQIVDALFGTGVDRPVEGYNASAPYHISPMADTDMMMPGNAYWVHVPFDTVWVVTSP
jgi:hypothetical protein